MRIILVGGTGEVGRRISYLLHQKGIDNIDIAASSKSAGCKVQYGSKELIIQDLEKVDFSMYDLAFFAVSSQLSQKYAPRAIKANCRVIDNSSRWRTEAPLIVPEVNAQDIDSKSMLISNPNCIAIPLSIVLKPLLDRVAINRVVVSTYQAVSGAGRSAVSELMEQINDESAINKVMKRRIAFNAVPQIGEIEENHYTGEENKVISETQKILANRLKIDATCVRVPVINCHSISVNIEFKSDFLAEDVIRSLGSEENLLKAKHIKVIEKGEEYVTALDCNNRNEVFVSRIRNNPLDRKSISLWITSDNLMKGAALNAVQIFECLRLLKDQPSS